MGQSRPLFVYFRHFLITISIIEKSIEGVLGIRTRGRRMVGTDETTELLRPPRSYLVWEGKSLIKEHLSIGSKGKVYWIENTLGLKISSNV